MDESRLAILAGSEKLGEFSGWLLAIGGATLALMFGNAETLRQWGDEVLVRVGVWLIIGSSGAGVIAKTVNVQIASVVAMAREMEKTVAAVMEQHDEDIGTIERAAKTELKNAGVDLQGIMGKVNEPLWRITRWMAAREWKRGWSDPGSGIRDAYVASQWRDLAVTVQTVLALGAAVVLVVGLL